MLSYDDVILGRLLLHDGAIGLPGLWATVRRVLEKQFGFREALTSGPLASAGGQEAVRRAIQNLSIVLRVEEDRTLARLLNDARTVDSERIRTLYALNRAQGFRDSLASQLRREGLLNAAQAARLTAEVHARLSPARREREAALRDLAKSLAPRYTQAEGERLRSVFELSLSGGQVRPSVIPVAQPTPNAQPTVAQPAPSREPAETLASAKAQTDGELRPEDCPIYGYEIIEELGKGSMGVVYKARHLFSGETRALKILPLRLAAKTQYLERFKREAMALMRIDHPNVVKGHDFGGSEEYYYLALEFIRGEPLDEKLKREGAFDEREALTITRQIALGLAAADVHGVVHRDIKPENVMITADGVAKICDFGIVKLADMSENSVTMAGTTVGTPFYISPEQAKGEDDLDIRSDIYSLGISLFHLTSGRVPFSGRSQGAILVRHILEEVPDPRTINPQISQGLAEIVARMCKKKRSERYASADELVAAIDAQLANPS